MKHLHTLYAPELVTAFKAALPALRQKISCIPFAERDARLGIGGNTFRAYQNWNNAPSVVYREWASVVSDTIEPHRLATVIASSDGFSSWHVSLADDLQRHWLARQGQCLSFAHLHKLIDLYVKWLSRYNFGSAEFTNAIVSHANCALDSQTINKMNQCLSLALPLSNPSMGDIHSRVTYNFCQEVIEDFAAAQGGTRLLFDYFAWQPGGGA
ncbi:hypothetical protein [Ideonella margarita]|uniref:Uncharacterized protein n=1 Tax=Ideonella margarita TaxID=2984191 RepID=A0ABU9C3K1_9BURK